METLDELAALGGPIPPGLGPVPFGPDTMPAPLTFQPAPPVAAFLPAPPAEPPAPVSFKLAPPAVPQTFKPAPPAVPPLDAVTGAQPPVAKVPMEGPPAPATALDVAERAKTAAIEKAYTEAETAADAADLTETMAAEREQIAKRAQANVDAAQARYDAAVTKYSGAEVRSYWADKTTSDKVVASFALAFGALGAGLSAFGGRPTGNLAAQGLMRNIDASYRKQVDTIERMGDAAKMARTGLQDAESAKAALLSDHDAKTAAGLKALEARGIATLKARGMTDAEIAGDHAIVELQKRQAELTSKNEIEARREAAELAYLEARTALTNGQARIAEKKARRGGGGRRLVQPLGPDGKPMTTPDGKPIMVPAAVGDKVTGSNLTKAGGGAGSQEYKSEVTGKPATDAERDADGYAERMATQLKVLKSAPPLSAGDREIIRQHIAQEVAAERSPGIDYAAKLVGLRKNLEAKLSPAGRVYQQALTEFAAANLRKESGAAISAKEYQDAFARFGAVTGDSPADLKRKQKAMEGVTASSAKRSHRPSHWLGVMGEGDGPAKGASAPKRQTGTWKGQKVEKGDDGKWHVVK